MCTCKLKILVAIGKYLDLHAHKPLSETSANSVPLH